MKILVTGGNGLVGSNLIKKLVNYGHTVVSIDDLSTGLKEYEIDGCNYYYGDIEHLIYWRGDDFDLCYHLASLSRIQPSFDDPMETFRVNTGGTQVVAEWARQNNVKVVYSGSSSKWADSSISPYATCKKLGEDILKMYRRVYGCNFEIVRFYNVYGPNELVDGKWAALIGIWRSQLRDGLPLTIVGDGEQRRDFTHIDDIVDGLIRIGFSDERHDDAWELGTGRNYSIIEVYEMFREKFGVSKIHIPDQKGNYRNSQRNNNDAIERFGWNPKDRLKNYIDSLSI